MKQMFSRLLSLFVVMFTMSLSSWGGSNKDYYSKAVAIAVGEGKVYVSTSSTSTPEYKEGSSEAENKGNASSAPTHKYYLYAQANEGYEFVGWYDNSACSGDYVSTLSPYELPITATENNPNTITRYAKFAKVGAPTLEFSVSRAYANISAGTYKNESLETTNVTGDITYKSSNENVAVVASDGTVTLKKNGTCVITAQFGDGEGSYILTVIDDVNAGITQIGNGDFEDWRNVTSSNHAPSNWNSFETAEGSYASTASAQQVAMVEGGRPGSDGLYCADIYSRDVMFGILAQGNLTLGCINAGNMSAENAANHNFSKVEDPAKSETISKIPSAIKFWVKFVPGSESYNARMAATVHDAYNYITYGQSKHDNDANKVHAIAQAEKNFPACEWTEMTVPFTMTGNAIGTQMYIVVNFTTNATPGGGGSSDHLYIDDVELVYDAEESTPAPTVYDKNMSVVADDEYLALTETSVEVTNNGEMTILGGETIKTIDFNLKDFSVGNSNVGDVAVRGLRINDDGTFNYNNSIQIAEGDMAGVHPMTLQGIISDDYFYVNINMDFGYSVLAEVGDVANTTLNISDALYGTFCAPFTVALPESVTASIITAANGNELILEPVAGNVVLANTPVLVEASAAESLSVSGIYAKGTPVAGLLTGVYENTPAPVGSYVLQNLDKVGFYLVAEGNQPTVGANRCYLTVPAAGVKAFFLNGGDATGISGVDANVDANEAIYNLAGQRINKLQKGINIINGKKILK
ncbi:MAG: hypothetical protein J6Q60_05180 [Bacteroidaceae bacterium]|nr:hypothetical protein [Bacteroidaceae bacterium]